MSVKQDLGQRLEAIEEIAFAYLFGSRGRGEERPDSDLDIAVYARR